MIVVTTPTGSIGSQLARLLVDAGERVRVVARDPAKLAPEVRAKAEVEQGASDDEAVMTRALAGATSLFHVIPPDFRSPDVTEHALRFARPAIAAMRAAGVTRVVTVSAIGRGSSMKAGPVTAAFAKDEAFERAGLDVRALWCPGFMENSLRDVGSIKGTNTVFGASSPTVRRPMVATRDIAAVAARLLRDASWHGAGGVGVLGAADVTLDEMAAIAGDVLGRPIRYQQIPAADYKARFISYGASEAMAQGLIDMMDAKDRGLDDAIARTADNSTPTTYRQWCIDVLKPAVDA